MATLQLGAERYEIAPFRLRELRMAAPFIDRLGARAGASPSVAAAAESAADMLAVLAVGLPDTDGEALLARASLSDMDAIAASFRTVMAEAGLTPADAPPGELAGAPAP
jgi:hypothetical protein